MRDAAVYAACSIVLVACRKPSSSEARPDARAKTAARPSAAVARDAASDAPAASAATCPPDMVAVRGEFCPDALQMCLRYHPEYVADSSVSERCLEFQSPSRCLSKARKSLHYCIDRFEWPNVKGEKPLVLVTWAEAKAHCESAGKRLCDEEEWLFACEGEAMLPHVYGFRRDPTKCQIDRPYRKRERPLKRFEPCMKNSDCKRDFDKLDQREPIGSFPECVSPFGAFDMNGSVNEWVNIPHQQYPNRSGLKGGWWGPVRNRCRPTVTFHKEDDWGYEAGFRCCKSD